MCGRLVPKTTFPSATRCNDCVHIANRTCKVAHSNEVHDFEFLHLSIGILLNYSDFLEFPSFFYGRESVGNQTLRRSSAAGAYVRDAHVEHALSNGLSSPELSANAVRARRRVQTCDARGGRERDEKSISYWRSVTSPERDVTKWDPSASLRRPRPHRRRRGKPSQ